MVKVSLCKNVVVALAVSGAAALFVSAASAQPVPPNYDGKDATYQISAGSMLRTGPRFTDSLAYTVWQPTSVKGNGKCTEDACPISFNAQNLFARRSRLRLGPGGPTPGTGQIAVTLRRGDSGPDVRRLQEALNKNGATLTVDANYGRGTVAAVEAFQKSKSLKVDGAAGSMTLRALGL